MRGPRLFNALPKELREFPLDSEVKAEQAVEKFKKNLDKYLKSIPDEPNLSSNYSQFVVGVNIYGKRTNSIIRL